MELKLAKKKITLTLVRDHNCIECKTGVVPYP
jgi:hypothetical protein